MAYAMIKFENPHTGRVREAPIGFSWTTLIFGFCPALLRGHWIMAFVIFVLCLFTYGIAGIVFAFIYNKMYVKHLIREGYKAAGATHDMTLLSQKVGQQIPALPA